MRGPASVLEQSTHTTTNSDYQGPTRISPGPLRKYLSGEWIAAEWLARMLMSVTVMQSSSAFDVRRPKSVGRFMATYGVAGLLGEG